jgi:nucleotide-binding universal stress UspA family protein
MRKTLIALDNSASALRAVEYAGSQFAGIGDLQIALVHVLPNLPAIFWDEGHILNDDEKKDREKVVDKWVADRKAAMEPVFRKATDILTRAGVKTQQVITRSITDSTDVSASLLEEARDKGYQTVVVGRCNHPVKHLLGNVSRKVVDRGEGLAVIVIG